MRFPTSGSLFAVSCRVVRMKPPPVCNCPRCGRPAGLAGVVTVAGVDLPVYQCDDCFDVERPPGAEPVEVALTWAVDGQGRMVDPAADAGSCDDPLRN